MTDLVAQQQPDQSAQLSWTVIASWQASGHLSATETEQTYGELPAARRAALDLASCRGVRYVQLQGPGHLVVGEYDRYTNGWREYRHLLGACGAEYDQDDLSIRVCGGEVYISPGAVQTRCATCGAREGTLSRPEWRALMFALGPPRWACL